MVIVHNAAHSRPLTHVQLYPYHLQDMLIQGLRVTAFVYYSNMLFELMYNEKSYDSLPNFTAADCKTTLEIILELCTALCKMIVQKK